MADPQEGLNVAPKDATARTTLKHLRTRWGSVVASGVPDVVEVSGMSREMWLRVDDGTKGENSTYVLEREYRG